MLHRKIYAALALAPLLITAACAAKPAPDIQPIPEVRNVYPNVPANLLDCAAEPVPGDILTDIDAAKFTEDVRTAGGDCRGKISSLKAMVAGWPK